MIKEIASWDMEHAYRRLVVYYDQEVKTGPNATYMEIRLRQNEWDFHAVGFDYVLSLLYSNQVNRMEGFKMGEGFTCIWKDQALVYSEEIARRAAIGKAVGM